MKSMLLWENTPVLEYYPAKEKRTNATVVICPGGPMGRPAAKLARPHRLAISAIFQNTVSR